MRKLYECGKCHNFFEDGAGKTLAVKKNGDTVIPCTCDSCRSNCSAKVKTRKRRGNHEKRTTRMR